MTACQEKVIMGTKEMMRMGLRTMTLMTWTMSKIWRQISQCKTQIISPLHRGNSGKAGDLSDSWDNEQRMRWVKFMNLADEQKLGEDILQAMELIEVDVEETKDQTEQGVRFALKNFRRACLIILKQGKSFCRALSW
jgi:hypothetical protein